MKRLRAIRRWFGRRFGYARLACVGLLIGVAALRAADPAPVQEIRVRTFDTFPGAPTPQEGCASGHHRRHRREEPRRSAARTMALALHADRRHRDQPHPARCRGDRLRRCVLRAGPAQPRYRGRHLQQPRRGDAGQAAAVAEQRQHPGRRHQELARGARRIRRPHVRADLNEKLPVTRCCDARRGAAAIHGRVSGAVAQRACARRGGGRTRPVHDQAGTRRYRRGACR